MDPQFLHFRFGLCSYINKDIVQGRCIFFSFFSHVDGRPTEDSWYHPLVRMDIDPHGGCDHVVGAPISTHVDIAVVFDVIDKPADLIGMCLNHHPIRCIGPDHCHRCTIGVGKVTIHIGLDVIQPDLLARSLKSRR